jgi:phage protein U
MQVKVDEAREAQEAAEREAAASRRAAARAQAYTLEVERLTDDNALLANRLEQMEVDLK